MADEIRNNMLDLIYTRRSVRKFKSSPVSKCLLLEIIKAGSWAPSGMNNQPWRFAVVADKRIKAKLSALTKYAGIISGAPACILVLLDSDAVYSDVKDHQAVGACIQNMLLAAHALGLGAVWLGEILKNSDKVRETLGFGENLQLMAVVALGHQEPANRRSSRKPLSEIIVYDDFSNQ